MKIKITNDELGLDTEREYEVLNTVTYHSVEHEGNLILVDGTDCKVISEGRRLGS